MLTAFPLATWQWLILGGYALVVLAAFSRHIACSHQLRNTRFLTPDCPRMGRGEAPLVSILVPAKDEAASIEDCLKSLLAQDYPNLEVLVVDDRSTDGTAGIVERMAAGDDRLRLITIDQLPEGWTGKSHALYVGQQHARGEWLLFVDADTRHHPSCLGVVLRDCLEHGIDMLSLLPALEARSFWEAVVQPFAGTCLMILYPPTQVNDPERPEKGFANGQFILVHRRAYELIGGHAAVRDKFVEDIHLARNVRRNGLTLRVAIGSGISSVRMYASLREIVRGWSRILYSAVDHSVRKPIALFAFICIFSVLPYAAILGAGGALLAGSTSPFARLVLGLGLVHEASQLVLYGRTYVTTRSRLRYLAFRWLAVFVMLYILMRTMRLCRTHEITWRGTKYTGALRRAVGFVSDIETDAA